MSANDPTATQIVDQVDLIKVASGYLSCQSLQCNEGITAGAPLAELGSPVRFF
jgi:hypothetical protein